jgi:hypothetical protein
MLARFVRHGMIKLNYHNGDNENERIKAGDWHGPQVTLTQPLVITSYKNDHPKSGKSHE